MQVYQVKLRIIRIQSICVQISHAILPDIRFPNCWNISNETPYGPGEIMSNKSNPDRNWCDFVRCRLFWWFIIFFCEILNKSKGNISQESNSDKILDDFILDVICSHDVIVPCERFGQCEALVSNKFNLTTLLMVPYRILFTFSIQSLLVNSLFYYDKYISTESHTVLLLSKFQLCTI